MPKGFKESDRTSSSASTIDSASARVISVDSLRDLNAVIVA